MKKYNNRSEVPEKYKWNLDEYYKSYEEFDKEYKKISSRLKELDGYKGKLKDSKKLLEFIEKDMEISASIMNLDAYIQMKFDEELGKDESITRQSKIVKLYNEYSDKASFFEPELLSFTEKEYKDLFKNKDLEKYRAFLDRIYRMKEHVLSEEKEIIVNRLSSAADNYHNIANNILNNENDYGTVKVDNEDITIALTNLRVLLKNKDQNIRREVYTKFYNEVSKYSGTLASLLSSYCTLNDEIAKIHNYKNAWNRKLFGLNLSNKVFETLVDTTEKNVDILHKYYELKKNTLGLDKLNVYDLSVPLVSNDKEYTIEEAQNICLEAVKPLGVDYYKHFEKIFNNSHIDYSQYKGKCSGGYCISTYDRDSRILMSFIGDLSSVSTIAHEGGHDVNHQYISENNDIIYRMIPNIMAEVMSLTNECLLSDYLLKNGKTKEEKLSGIENIMKVIVSNLYGAVREGKIEQQMYEIIESGSSLTKDNMKKLVSDSLDKYYGKYVVRDELANLDWATRSHYYMNYYMYSYSICICVASNIAREIIRGNKEILDKYISFLKTGGNIWAYDAFKMLGVDLEDKKVYENAFKYFDELIEEFKKLSNN